MRGIALFAAVLPASLLAQSVPETVHARGNPVLADGRFYSTDPAPFVDGDTPRVLAGRDEAPAGVNDFVMNEWQLLARTDPAGGTWRHYPAIARPVRFPPVTARCPRAVLDASQAGGSVAGVGMREWEALAPMPAPPRARPTMPVAPCGGR